MKKGAIISIPQIQNMFLIYQNDLLLEVLLIFS